jgi:hypothetical protein
VSIGRQKNNSLPQKPSLENVQPNDELSDHHHQSPHQLPKGVNQFGNGDYYTPYGSNPSYERRLF